MPILAIDARLRTSPRLVLLLFVAAGLLAAFSFGLEFLSNRRHFADLPLTHIVLPSFLLATSLFCYGTARAIVGERHRVRWLGISALIAAILLLTGTRSTLALLVAPVVLVIAGRAHLPVRILGLAGLVVAAAVMTVVITMTIDAFTPLDSARLASRFDAIPVLDQRGGDPSFIGRVEQTKSAWAVFLKQPLVGAGPGYSFSWIDPLNGPTVSTTVLYLRGLSRQVRPAWRRYASRRSRPPDILAPEPATTG